MQRCFPWFSICAFLCFAVMELHAQAHPAAAPDATKAVLVELFTSEGCSSCPPADMLLRQLNETQTAGQLIVGVSEHVTYWNQLGWSDPFSSPIFTERQNGYSQRFGLDSVYTPQMVIGGRTQLVGSDRAGVLRAIQQESEKASSVTLHILGVNIEGDRIKIRFSAASLRGENGADVFAILTDDADESKVLRGENGGRTLKHVAVARTMTRIARVRTGAEQTAETVLPDSFHKQGAGHHLILFAQSPDLGAVLGVATQSL